MFNFSNNELKSGGIFFIRILAGSIFFYQGIDILFISGINAIYADIFVSGTIVLLPEALIKGTIGIISLAQMFGGSMLLLGILRNHILYSFLFVILFIAIVFGNSQNVWQFELIVFQALLSMSLLMMPLEWDKLRVKLQY